jgi:4-carboxymuconolactone decarboxylase
VDYIDRLRRLAINDPRLADDLICRSDVEGGVELDPKTVALVRIASLVAVGGAPPSFGTAADAAVTAGASAAEIVEVLAAITRIVGLPRVVAAAPNLAIALGYDLDDEALEA